MTDLIAIIAGLLAQAVPVAIVFWAIELLCSVFFHALSSGDFFGGRIR